jgi:hypothetical protein
MGHRAGRVAPPELRGVMAQDRLLSLAQLEAGFDADVGDEPNDRSAVRRRVGICTRRVLLFDGSGTLELGSTGMRSATGTRCPACRSRRLPI